MAVKVVHGGRNLLGSPLQSIAGEHQHTADSSCYMWRADFIWVLPTVQSLQRDNFADAEQQKWYFEQICSAWQAVRAHPSCRCWCCH